MYYTLSPNQKIQRKNSSFLLLLLLLLLRKKICTVIWRRGFIPHRSLRLLQSVHIPVQFLFEEQWQLIFFSFRRIIRSWIFSKSTSSVWLLPNWIFSGYCHRIFKHSGNPCKSNKTELFLAAPVDTHCRAARNSDRPEFSAPDLFELSHRSIGATAAAQLRSEPKGV